MWLIGTLLSPLMTLAGIGLLIVGLLDRKDGPLVAGAILLGSVLIAGRRTRPPAE